MFTKAELFTRKMPLAERSDRLSALSESDLRIQSDWVLTTFLSDVVRLGTGAENLDTTYPPQPSFEMLRATNEQITRFLYQIPGNEIVAPNRERYQHLAQEYGLPQQFNRVSQALSVLCHPFFRRGAYETMGRDFLRGLHTQLSDCAQYGFPLKIVLPTLPFKDQSAVTTGQSIETVDLGEHLFLRRLDMLVRSLQDLHFSASVEIVADGTVYADIFTQNGHDHVAQYLHNCRQIIEQLQPEGVSPRLKVTDLADIVALEPAFASTRQHIQTLLNASLQMDSPAWPTWEALLRGMLFNCQLPTPFNQYPSFSEIVGLSIAQLAIQHPELFAIIRQAALEYASFLMTMKKLKILQRRYSSMGSIRATVHPKKDQFGLQTLGSEVAPYNGVTIVNESEFVRNPSLLNQNWYACQRLYTLFEENDIRQLTTETGDTFCYLR